MMLPDEMTEDLLESLSSGYPLLCAEHTFISCKIKDGNVIPVEGVNQPALEKVITGDVAQKYIKSTRFLEKFQISYFLSMLRKQKSTEEEYELESYPKLNMENHLNHSHYYCSSHSRTCDVNNTSIRHVIDKKRNESNCPNFTSEAFDSDSEEEDQHDVNRPTSLDHLNLELESNLHRRVKSYICWLSSDEGKDYVFTESFSSVKEALTVLSYLKRMEKPSLVTLLARENEPVIVSFSSIHIGLECVLFCLFQA